MDATPDAADTGRLAALMEGIELSKAARREDHPRG
ncbi:MAG: hypothetical protein ACI9OJ_000303 [Myxococcota bacterium]|jgi:hypothetical protein